MHFDAIGVLRWNETSTVDVPGEKVRYGKLILRGEDQTVVKIKFPWQQ